MHDHLGWSLPLDVLPAWVQGEPFPTVPVANLARDEEGRVTGFSQLGWAVVLERYQSVEEGLGVRDLPTRITASRADARVRLVISEWRF
jgi:outer membrane biogenesis lipoprotein LolB